MHSRLVRTSGSFGDGAVGSFGVRGREFGVNMEGDSSVAPQGSQHCVRTSGSFGGSAVGSFGVRGGECGARWRASSPVGTSSIRGDGAGLGFVRRTRVVVLRPAPGDVTHGAGSHPPAFETSIRELRLIAGIERSEACARRRCNLTHSRKIVKSRFGVWECGAVGE